MAAVSVLAVVSLAIVGGFAWQVVRKAELPRLISDARLLMLQGEYREGIAKAELVLAHDPSNIDALLVRARDLLATDGVLLLTSSYSWDERNTPPDRWWDDGPATLRQRLADLGLRLLEERDDLVWAIPGTGRSVFRYRLDSVLAKRS